MWPATILGLLVLCSAFVQADVILSPLNFRQEQEYYTIFNTPLFSESLPDVRASPNIATRLEVTSHRTKNSSYCGLSDDQFVSGYAHITNAAGEEDKHLFWWLFKARHDPDTTPVVMTLGGGPGASGMLFPFSGAGPCAISVNEDGHGEASASPYSWTEYVNVLAIDHPVGVGFSYGERTSLRNSSLTAAWDTDDFLQAFWNQYPHLTKNQFIISSGSYGGHFVPNIVSVIRERNTEGRLNASSTRTQKMPESVMLVNICSDPATHYRWMHQSLCNRGPEGNMFFNETYCVYLAEQLPECLDSIDYAYQQQNLDSKVDATHKCAYMVGELWEKFPERDPYDHRTKCPPEGCDYLALGPVEDVLNSTAIKDAVGVSHSIDFKILALADIGMPFIESGDMIQPAHLLLAPAIEDGLRLFVYNGMQDGACPWRSSLAWMRLLETKHQSAFRSTPEVEHPEVGSIRKVGPGAGNYMFIKIQEAGHMVIRSQPELLRHLMIQWVRNEEFF
ncbi:hypothetical protein GYMLUDRAFT_41820 [Collybiopsis luxurians FD-317 M1]|uniref:Carboxypeptidase n=1 Tax=Collybiopsis luxurians FD-317 M1 TaxID=944289 RepID=A0A0D0C2P2_9AGAR|nr:hypothetical protein GYMLUDRAFT_41820 [Collybiopsis luxurians FD-317 M1]